MKTYRIEIIGDGEIEDIIKSLEAICDELNLRSGKWIDKGKYFHGVASLKMNLTSED